MPPRCQLLLGRLGTPGSPCFRPQSSQRGFSSSSAVYKNPLARRQGGDLGKHLPKYVIPQDSDMPEYPYGPNRLFKQANGGLYGGQMIQFGNNISNKTETTTRRYWKPNILSKSLYSIALKKKIKLRMTTKVLRIIDNEGGLDEYLLKPTEARIKELGPLGWALRWTLLQKPEVVQRMRADATRLGIDEEEIDKQWPMPHPALIAEAENADLKALNQVEATPEIIAAKAADAKIQKLANAAALEYKQTIEVAKNYVRQDKVDTINEGITVAFVMERERAFRRAQGQEYREKRAAAAAAGTDAGLSGQSYYAARVAEAGGKEAYIAMIRADYVQRVADARKGQTDPTLPEADRLYFQVALEKAQRAIEAKSMEEYVEATVDANAEPTESKPTGEKDAWAALVDTTAPSSEQRTHL